MLRQRLAFAVIALICLVFTAAGGLAAPVSTFSGAESLEEIRAIIKAQGYAFTVADNPITRLSPDARQALLSRHPPLYPSPARTLDRGPLARLVGRTELPASFDWRNVDGQAYIGPIRNQLNCGSCYSFGAAATAEGAINVLLGLTGDATKNYSEAFIAFCLGSLPEYNQHFSGCGGSDYDYLELTALTEIGIADETAFPYVDQDPGGCPAWDAPLTRFAGWYRVPCSDVAAIKTAILTYGPIDASVWVGSAFQAYESGIYEDDLTDCDADPCYYTDTNHVIALVGWNDNGDPENEGYWILRNSWGTTWGEDGYMRIKYHSARVACEAAYLVPFAGSAKTFYLPHLTASDPAWTDVLEVDNTGGATASFSLVFKPDGQGSGNLDVPAQAYAVHDLTALAPTAQAAVITTESDALVFRQAYVSPTGGLAECPASSETMTTGNLVFDNFSPLVAWKGLAVYNAGTATANVSLAAYGGGRSLASLQTTIPIGGRLKARPSELWPGLSDADVERVNVVSDQPVSGLSLTGSSDAVRLTCLPAQATE